jgi:putative protein-disulfide isomerase
MENQLNPLLCDIETGMCEIPEMQENETAQAGVEATQKPLKVIYYTDPICSSCWGIEPQLRKLKLEYGKTLDIDYRMGGLLPDWSYNSGGISKPSDVAHHWDEVSRYYDMPIDGDVWLEDPMNSSYPPSIAFKAAQLQDKDKAIEFLRELRELLFLQKKNISRWEHMAAAAEAVGLNIDQLKTDYGSSAKALFQEDLQLGRELGVRGFPSMFFVDEQGNREFVYGSKPYSAYENAIQKLAPKSKKSAYDTTWKGLFSKFQTLTAKEFSVLSEMNRQESERFLDNLTEEGKLEKFNTKNGAMWKLATN